MHNPKPILPLVRQRNAADPTPIRETQQMHPGAKNLLIAIIGFLLLAVSASYSAAVDHTPTASPSDAVLRSALHLAEESAQGFVLVPGLLDSSAPESSNRPVAHLEYQPPHPPEKQSPHDPQRLNIDTRNFLPSRSRISSAWQTSVDVLAASRLNEDVTINGVELGTGINSGMRARVAYRAENLGNVINAWNVIAFGLGGKESLAYDPSLYFAPDPYDYQASLVSVESNVIRRTEHRRRVREQFVGIRYVDQSDSIETIWQSFNAPRWQQETHNRMLGLQAGIDQSWFSGDRWRFSWGVKGGLFYSSADQAGYLYDGTATQFPLLLDYHADLALRIFQQAYLEFGLIGLSLADQYQSRFAWQAPESTHSMSLLGMRLGFDYSY